jgi:hypothetical protein
MTIRLNNHLGVRFMINLLRDQETNDDVQTARLGQRPAWADHHLLFREGPPLLFGMAQ